MYYNIILSLVLLLSTRDVLSSRKRRWVRKKHHGSGKVIYSSINPAGIIRHKLSINHHDVLRNDAKLSISIYNYIYIHLYVHMCKNIDDMAKLYMAYGSYLFVISSSMILYALRWLPRGAQLQSPRLQRSFTQEFIAIFHQSNPGWWFDPIIYG